MSYTALYRKFRPASFDEVKGQDPVVKTLRNQIRADRLGHAYLFCGTRGTGKTSVAKIFAKAVNCEHPADGNPCNECASCRSIAAGTSMNVIEIDAASNNGVDNIREIREEVAYSPTEGRYKVYIIDEVHMLSTGAFNALLKTLEEPPSYVIFILATTEAHKIPVTILSRCQRYDFRRIGQETILSRLRELTDEEQIEAEEKALRYIARKSDGALRDALSLLDQCIAFYLGEKLTYDRVLEVLGAVDTDVFSDLLRKLLRGELTEAIRTLDHLIMQGRDLTQFVNDFTWYLRNLMLMKASDDMEEMLDVSGENLKQLREEAAMIRSDTLMRYIRILSELSNSIRYATNKRVQLEMALIRLCKPETQSDELSVLERVRKLERVLSDREAFFSTPIQAAGAPGRWDASMTAGQAATGAELAGGQGMPGASDAAQAGLAMSGGYPSGAPETTDDVLLPRAVPEDLKKICGMWKQIINGLPTGGFRTTLASAVPKYNTSDPEDNKLYVVFSDYLAERYMNRASWKEELEQLISDQTGKKTEVRFVLEGDEGIQRGTLVKIEADQVDKLVHERVNIDIDIVSDEDSKTAF
ncbi:MAG: DNA polymerase III subunit gamma/tau [Lachnospiraceae bacterium]|nr:DNA polymerase III subunit gamma/tau [Lachnospiraceae bacterium]